MFKTRIMHTWEKAFLKTISSTFERRAVVNILRKL
jgi:hypothetical protein